MQFATQSVAEGILIEALEIFEGGPTIDLQASTDPVLRRQQPYPFRQWKANGTTWSWNGPAGSSSNQSWTINNISLSDAGNYDITVTDANGCSAIDAITVNVIFPLPTANMVVSPTSACEGQSISISFMGNAQCQHHLQHRQRQSIYYPRRNGQRLHRRHTARKYEYDHFADRRFGRQPARLPLTQSTTVTITPAPTATVTAPATACEGAPVTFTFSGDTQCHHQLQRRIGPTIHHPFPGRYLFGQYDYGHYRPHLHPRRCQLKWYVLPPLPVQQR